MTRSAPAEAAPPTRQDTVVLTATWHTAASAMAEAGRTLPTEQASVQTYLDVSMEQCLAYLGLDGEDIPTPELIPHGWRLAHLLHAQDLYASAQRGDRTDVGSTVEGYIPSRPRMTGVVRNLLTPYRTGVASMIG